MKRNHTVRWAGGLQFIGTAASGHSLVIDGDRDVGMSPMEMLLLAAGACAAIDLVTILKKGRQKVMDATVEVGGERRDDHPRYYTAVSMHFVVYGQDVKPRQVERAIDLAMEKYCSASAQLKALADVETSFEIVEAELPS
ncbi:MAG: OsmC family protein [Xanthomonadales bacterium]|jgi:putative redox protein|nr:OsmC family protein [Xanthomonadales bacterium]